MKGTPLPTRCGGAFVNVYLSADNVRQAIDLAEESFLNDLYKPVETTSVYQLESDEYEKEYYEEGDPSKEDLLNLHKTGGVWYCAFHTYPPETKDVH